MHPVETSLVTARPSSSSETNRHMLSSPKTNDDASRLNIAAGSSPPFILSPGEYIEIKLNGENSEALKLVLEFLYTDRIMSLEGKEHELDTVKLMVDVYKIANQVSSISFLRHFKLTRLIKTTTSL